jgi:putative ABC transport system ATP-binding protein
VNPTSDTPALRARDLRVVLAVDGRSVSVLDGVTLDVGAGEVVDVVGGSGAGKSTLLRALARLMPGATGEIELEGASAAQIAPGRWRSRVALVGQKPALGAATIAEDLAVPWTLAVRRGEQPPTPERMREALDVLGLSDVALGRDVERLSVGQRSRIAFARTLLTTPAVLLLDEVDAALDDVSAACVTAATHAFCERGGAVVRVRHRADDGLADRRLRLAAGTLAAEAVR